MCILGMYRRYSEGLGRGMFSISYEEEDPIGAWRMAGKQTRGEQPRRRVFETEGIKCTQHDIQGKRVKVLNLEKPSSYSCA